jgi:hypothetical protein
MAQNPAHLRSAGDQGDELHLGAAARAHQWADFMDLFQKMPATGHAM